MLREWVESIFLFGHVLLTVLASLAGLGDTLAIDSQALSQALPSGMRLAACSAANEPKLLATRDTVGGWGNDALGNDDQHVALDAPVDPR